ncbi:MAG: M28 family peptidase, partial [Candidatus Zixiibacteriota bacterium]
TALYQMIDLDSLISLVSQDSLQSYTERLQAFYRRVAGTDSNYVSRDWIAAKLTSFGYDSVVIDSFVADLSGIPSECQNVLAYKIGSRFPGQHIIIGAHRDAVPGSPGADDNGSGTAAVMEIARVLHDIETDMTFVFALFDAEEYGLYGSWHYVTEANIRGDSIVYMLNMDMIAHYQNSTQAKLYYGSDVTYSQLWQSLADSLVGINAVLSGSSSGSDHYPFAQNGYDVTFAHEYIFSTVYHSSQDSTTYMSFPYMTKMVKVSLATAYVVNATAWPQPVVVFDYPEGVPKMLDPGVPTTFDVVVSGAWEGVPVPGSGQLHYAVDGGGYTTVFMTEISTNHYEATLPAADCDTKFTFYVSADEETYGTFYDPDTSSPYTAVVATGSTVVFEDDFETDKGWTVYGDALDGQWDRGVPVGGGDRGDPPTDFDGSGQCYLTDNVDGNSDVDDGTTYLESPTFDLSLGDGEIHYARWYSNNVGNAPFSDVMNIYISNNNGTTWTLVETVGPVEQAAGDFVTPTSQMKMLFEVSDLGAGSVVEAAVDDFTVTVYDCEAYVFYISTDSLPDWTVNQPYSQQLEAVGGTGQKTWLDKYLDLPGTGLNLSIDGLLSGTPSDTGTISFTALVTDELDSTAEKSFSFNINPAVLIVTDSLPDGIEGEPYSQQLLASGGTGDRTWTDKYNDLSGTGLTFSTGGLLAGTPTVNGTISFTARVVDVAGSADEKPFSFTIEPAYICGDINGDGSNPNVVDVTYLVDYLMRSGPPPPVMEAANVDGEGGVNVADITYLVNYLFRNGPAPIC